MVFSFLFGRGVGIALLVVCSLVSRTSLKASRSDLFGIREKEGALTLIRLGDKSSAHRPDSRTRSTHIRLAKILPPPLPLPVLRFFSFCSPFPASLSLSPPVRFRADPSLYLFPCPEPRAHFEAPLPLLSSSTSPSTILAISPFPIATVKAKYARKRSR